VEDIPIDKIKLEDLYKMDLKKHGLQLIEELDLVEDTIQINESDSPAIKEIKAEL